MARSKTDGRKAAERLGLAIALAMLLLIAGFLVQSAAETLDSRWLEMLIGPGHE